MLRANLKSQQGIVIVIALFIVALIAAMSYVMMARLMRDTERTTLIVNDKKAENFAEGSVLWAMDVLRNDWENRKPNQLVDKLPVVAPLQTFDGFQVQTTIYDLQARFNLNNLIGEAYQPDFVKLVRSVNKALTEEEAMKLAKSVTAWLLKNGSENDQYYSQLPIPYRPAHRLMQSPSELLLIKGMTPTLYQALNTFVCALPVTTQINMNSADAPVIASLSPTMTIEAAETIMNVRQQKPFVSTDDVMKLDIVKNHNLPANKMTVTSNYFLIETIVTIEKQQSVLYTILERSGSEGKAIMTRLLISKGIW